MLILNGPEGIQTHLFVKLDQNMWVSHKVLKPTMRKEF